MLVLIIDTPELTTAKGIRKTGIIYFAVFAFALIPILLIGNLIPSNTPRQNFEKRGDLMEKTLTVLFASVFTLTETALSTALHAEKSVMRRRVMHPGWFNNRASIHVST
ncbi:unnamed protein product, partial [Tuber aestivum]